MDRPAANRIGVGAGGQIRRSSALQHLLAHGKMKCCDQYAAFCRVLRLAISSRGPGRRPLTAETRVLIPVSLPTLGMNAQTKGIRRRGRNYSFRADPET